MATVEARDGRPVLVREGGDALRREAAVLATLAGPGVPELLDCDDDGDAVRLVISMAPRVPRVDRLVAAEVAAVLARAHGAGLCHGALLDEHVGGAPGAILVGGWDAAGPGDPRDDVRSFGRLLERHAGDDRSLRRVAERALAPDPPTMPAIAAALAGGERPVHHHPSVRGPARALVAGSAVAAGLVLAGLAVAAGPGGSGGTSRQAPPAPPTADVAAPAARPPVSTSTTITTTKSTAWLAHRIAVDGNVVARDGNRWSVGEPGDVVVVGDWDCDGQVTVALLRPATGEVWTFADWSGRAGRPVARVPGAESVRVESDGRCDRLTVVGSEGQSTMVG